MDDTNLGRPRLARPEEADVLRRIVADAYSRYVARMGRPPGPMLDDYAQRIADGQAWVLEEDGNALLLDNVAVSSFAQGKGYGQTLIAFAEEEARRRGCVEVRLYTNVLMTENIAFYGRLGYRETGVVCERGYERVYMAKALG